MLVFDTACWLAVVGRRDGRWGRRMKGRENDKEESGRKVLESN